MRAISPIGNYSIQLIEAKVKRGMDSTGTVVEYSDGEPVLAQFHRGGLTEWEQIEAMESFDFSGLPEGINPLTRVSMFDSEAYVERFSNTQEREHKLRDIDERLTYLSGLFPSEFKIVAKPSIASPWAKYDETPIEDVLDDGGSVVTPGIYTMQSYTGISPQDIRLYEVENLNRPEVVEAMEALENAMAGLANVTQEDRISVSL